MGGGAGRVKPPKPWINGSLKPAEGIDPATEEEVTDYLAEHPEFDEGAQNRLWELHPKLQKMVISKGPLRDVENPSSCLLHRCRIVSSMKSDDWICIGCMSARRKK